MSQGQFTLNRPTDSGDEADFDYGNPETWRFMAEVARHWVCEFDLDGFGLDVPDLLPRNFVRYLKRQLLAVKGGDMFILAESSGAHVEEWAWIAGTDF